ncbi:MAG: hypothetical protein MUC66_01295 [Methanolinea sp.]|jgi:hypothetical protein|nr:hypothetical protein [Methanolinea sp.]
MEEKQGKFVQGAWIEDKRESREEKGSAPIDQRIDQVSSLVSTSLHQVLGLARDLITTPEGHAHIEKQINQAASQVESALSEILRTGKEEKEGDDPGGKEKKIRIR